MVHTETRAEEPFNPGELLETFMGDLALAQSVLSRFLERTGEQLRSFPAMEDRGDWQSARREAHTIKGSASTLSGRELGRKAALLEQACLGEDRAAADAAFPPLEEAFLRFREGAEAWLGKGGA